jgi:hypothetical protein
LKSFDAINNEQQTYLDFFQHLRNKFEYVRKQNVRFVFGKNILTERCGKGGIVIFSIVSFSYICVREWYNWLFLLRV